MGATRPASGHFQQPRPASEFKAKAHRQACNYAVCESLLVYKHCIFPTRDASPPLEVALGGSTEPLKAYTPQTDGQPVFCTRKTCKHK